MIIMSNNQWKCDKNAQAWKEMKLDCSADYRVPFLVKAYIEVMPDLLCLQEVSRYQAKLMMERLSTIALSDGTLAKYEYVFGGDTPLVYRYDLYKIIASGFFRYDEAVPGLEGSFNNAETKSYCWGVFEHRKTATRVAVMSTHLWWKSSDPESSCYQAGSDEARAYQIKIACEQMEKVMAEFQCPGFILGDFNARMESPCLKEAQALGWQEAHDVCLGECAETRGHHHCDGSGFVHPEDYGTFAQAIDHIILKGGKNVKINSFKRLTPRWFDAISDHYPLYIDVDFA